MGGEEGSEQRGGSGIDLQREFDHFGWEHEQLGWEPQALARTLQKRKSNVSKENSLSPENEGNAHKNVSFSAEEEENKVCCTREEKKKKPNIL